MAKYSMQDRKDMSIGMKNYDKGYNKGRNERYMSKMQGNNQKILKNEGMVKQIETCNAEQYDMNRVQWRPYNRRGYDMQAYDYKW